VTLVNLISSRRARRRRLQRTADALIRAIYVTVIVIGAVVFLIVRESRKVEAEIARVEAEIESYEPLAGEVRVLRASLERLTPRVQLAEVTELNVNRWRYLLAQIADAFPRGAWLDSFSTRLGPDGGEIFSLSCRSKDVYSAAKLFTRLEAEPDVKSVKMNGGTWSKGELTFELEVSIKPPASSAQVASK